MTSRTGAEIVVDFLNAASVPYLIGIPGHTDVHLLDAVEAHRDAIQHLIVRHEETAAFMADAYFRITHKPLAIYTHMGPGALNAMIGVANAFYESSSMLVFTGEAPAKFHGRGAGQEMARYEDAELPGLFKPITKRSWLVKPSDVPRLDELLMRGYSLALSGRPGPVHFDITMDAFAASGDSSTLPIDKHFPFTRVGANDEAVTAAVKLLVSAERPTIVAGQGVLLSDGTADLAELAEMLGAPVATTNMGKGCISESHPLSMGVTGRWGTEPANRATREADVVLAVGTRLSETDTGSWTPGQSFEIPPTKLIHIDIDASEIGKYYPTEVGIMGDAKVVLRQIISALKLAEAKQRDGVWVKRSGEEKAKWKAELAKNRGNDGSPVNPARIVKLVQEMLPPDAVVVTDAGKHQKWFVQQYDIKLPGTFLTSLGFGSMGFGACGALGAKLARPDKPVVCVVGDGSLTMVPHVLATAFENALPVIYLVFNDFQMSGVVEAQRSPHKVFGTQYRHVNTGEPYNPDFVEMARAFHCEGASVQDSREFSGHFQNALKADIPYVIDLRIDKDAKVRGY